MSELSLVLPEIGKPDTTEDPKIVTAFTAVQTWANGNVGTTNIAAEGVNEANLVKVAGTVFAVTPETIRSWSARVVRVLATEYEPSASRPANVYVIFAGVETAAAAKLTVGGVEIAEWAPKSETAIVSSNFICPKGVKWKLTTSAGGLTKLESSQMLL